MHAISKKSRWASAAALCAVAVAAALSIASCGRSDSGDARLSPDVLVAIGNDKLTTADLRSAMPGGLSQADSAKFAQIYVRQWIDRRLAQRMARDVIDMDEIDRMVEDYRYELIMRRYAVNMYESHVDTTFATDTLRHYYENHPAEFRLQRPLVKGVYLKIPADAPNLAVIRKLYHSDKPDDIDRLEKEVAATAIHYDYFRDRWIDWEQVEMRIPYEFGSPSDNYLRSHRNLDFTDGSFVYLLDVAEYLPTGSLMPFEAAEPLVRRRLEAGRRIDYERSLRQAIFDRAVQNGTLRINCQLGQ